MTSNIRPLPDQILVDVADYVVNFRPGREALDAARLCVADTLACALAALDYPECTKLVGPIVPGIVVPLGSRIPGTCYEVDPATAAFGLGCLIRWLDFNDQFGAAQGSHPSDNLAGVLALCDYLSRQRVAVGLEPLTMSAVLDALVKAYEIQGCLALENYLNGAGIDHALLTRVASSAVLTHLLGGTHEQIVNAISNAFMDCSLAVFRHAPNTGWRKSWSAADAVYQAMRLAFMAVKGEMGYPSVLTAKQYGFYDARFGGKPFSFQRTYGDFVIRHSIFKIIAAGMHGQSAAECAFRLHPAVRDRLDDIDRIEMDCHRALLRIMNKTGPLHNPADRDHCVQYIVAVGLLHGRVLPGDFEDEVAADPRIDQLRAKMVVHENPQYSSGYYDPDQRSNANAIQVFFKDGSCLPRVEIEYPGGHPRRRTESMHLLRQKRDSILERRFTPETSNRISAAFDDARAFEHIPVDQFLDMFVI